MQWNGRVWRWGWLLPVVFMGGCLFGGQTGETSNASGSSGGGPICGPPSIIDIDAESAWGFSGREMLEQYGGIWRGTVETSSGTAPQGAIVSNTGDSYPVEFSVSHHDGFVLEADCTATLQITVSVTLQLGENWIDRTGEARLEGDLSGAMLEVDLLPGEGETQETVTLMMALGDSAEATGTVSVGDWWGTVTVAKE